MLALDRAQSASSRRNDSPSEVADDKWPIAHLFARTDLACSSDGPLWRIGHPGRAAARRGAAGRAGHDPGPALPRELVSGRWSRRRPGAAGAWGGLRARRPEPCARLARRLRGHRAGQQEAGEYGRARAAGAARDRRGDHGLGLSLPKDVAGFALVPDGRWTAAPRASESGLAFTRRARHYSPNNGLRGPHRRPGSREERPCRAAITRSTPPGSATRRPSGPRPRARSTGTSPGTRCSTPMRASTAAGSSAPSATRPGTASTGTSSAAAARQKALIYDSPVTKTHAGLHLRRAARRGGDARRRAAGPGRGARATGSSSTCRWCPRR